MPAISSISHSQVSQKIKYLFIDGAYLEKLCSDYSVFRAAVAGDGGQVKRGTPAFSGSMQTH